MLRLLILGCILLLLSACNQVDNYILGKENLPKPKELKEIKSKVNMTNEWSLPIAKKSKSQAYLKLRPVILGETMYLAVNKGIVQAVDKNNGKVLWSKNVEKSIVSGPAVANNSVIVGTNAATIINLDKTSGKIKWKAPISEDSLSKAIILQDRVIVKTIDGNIYAFDIKNGKEIWKTEHGSPNLILKASSSPVVVDGVVLVGFSDGKLDALDVKDGRLLWQRSIVYATGSSDVEKLIDIDADPIVHNGVVYIASYQGYISGISLQTGQFLWSKAGSVYKNMALAKGILYVVDSRDTIWAFDDATGRVIWKQTALQHHGLTDPTLMGNKLLVGDNGGYLHVVSIKNGELIGRRKLGSAINISPVVSKDIAYSVLQNGTVSAVKVL